MTTREPQAPEPSTESAADPAGRRRAGMPAGRIVIAVVAVAVLVVSGIGWRVLDRADTALAQHQVDALLPDDPNIRTPQPSGTDPTGTSGTGNLLPTGDTGTAPTGAAPTGVAPTGVAPTGVAPTGVAPTGVAQPVSPAEAAALPAENILILGLDTRGNGEGGVGPGTSQSDVIMVAHLHAGHRQMSVLSIPRDLYVPAPTCKVWNNATGQVSDHTFDNHFSTWKITNAYSVGGPRCTVQAIQALTGLRMDRLIAIQFDGFSSIVNALGGVTMTFPGPVIDKNQGVVISHAGTQTVNGAQALKLVRSRIVQGDPSGDLGRIHRQQQLISAMMHRMSSSGAMADPARMDQVVQAFVANSTTQNVTVTDLLSLAKQLGGGGKALTFTTLPTVPATGSDGLDKANGDDAIFAALANDQPLSGRS